MIGLGEIIAFEMYLGSEIATMYIEDDKLGEVTIPCEKEPTLSALVTAFDDVIGSGDTFNLRAIEGQRIFYSWDKSGLTLGGFVREGKAPREVLKAYRKQEEG